MTSVYNQKTAAEMYLREQCDIAKKEGRQEGMLNICIKMFKQKIINALQAATELGMTEKEFLSLANNN